MIDSGPPVMMIATVDEESAALLDEELRRRYGGDYEVVTARGYEHGRAILDGLRHWGRSVAMVFACYNPDDREGLAFLRRARALHPSAKRAIVVRWGDFASSAPVFRAIAEGHAELSLLRPERRRDEEFHGSITDVLDDWHLSNGTGLRGRPAHRPPRRAHPHPARQLRPQPHPRRLLRRRHAGRSPGPGGDGGRGPRPPRPRPRLPIMVLEFTSPPTTLVNPTDIEIADAFGLMTPAVGRHHLRRGDHRVRPGRSRRGRVRGERGPEHDGRRAPGRRWAGGHQLPDPELPRVLPWHQRRPPRLPLVPAGVVVRGRVPLHAQRGRPAGRRRRPGGRAVGRGRGAGPVGDRRHRRRLPPPRRAGARGAHRPWGLLRRRGVRGAGDGRVARVRDRRRQLGRARPRSTWPSTPATSPCWSGARPSPPACRST